VRLARVTLFTSDACRLFSGRTIAANVDATAL
jgi:hypothetical protein